MDIVNKNTDELIPYINNARTHSPEQVTQIAASIKEFGFCNPVLIDKDSGIIAGHGRVMAAQKLGLETVPTIELSHLTDIQRKAYILADNRLAEKSGWDDELLRLELGELQDLDFDLSLIGFDDFDLTIDEIPAALTDEDEVPEPPDEPVTKLGDVWLLGNHRLMCGDSTSIDAVDKLMNGVKADMVFTDPPYGVDYDGGHANKTRRDKLKNDDNVNMYDLPIKNAFFVSNNESPLYLWFADRFAENVLTGLKESGYIVRNWIIWNKNLAQFGAIGAHYKSKHEPCIYAFKKGYGVNWQDINNEVTVWDISRESKNEYHPTQKPIALAERAIKNHNPKFILDLFGGSGSTLIACEKTNRINYSMELDEKYCDVIVNRWQNYTGKQATLESTGEFFGIIKEEL